MRIRVDDLACRRGERRVLAGVSFGLGPGEALLVTGRNGAGKSTLLAAVAGLLRPESGTIRLVDADERSPAEILHLVGHRDGLKGALTAAENVAFAADVLGDRRSPAHEALARVGLAAAASVPVSYLSAGQRRRVALARLVAADRPLWLLDEPTTALDAASLAMVVGLVAEHRAAGGLVVAATHAVLDLPGAAELRLAPPAGRPDLQEAW